MNGRDRERANAHATRAEALHWLMDERGYSYREALDATRGAYAEVEPTEAALIWEEINALERTIDRLKRKLPR